MSTTRQQVYNFANNLAKEAIAEGLPRDVLAIEPGSPEDDYFHGLLNKVEDDRAHREAEKIRKAVAEDQAYRPKGHAAMLEAADSIDPYEMRDGELVHKSDGSPVII